MKLFLKKLGILIFLTIFLILIFEYRRVVTVATLKGMELWITKVFPSLFIMFIINDLIINTNCCFYINKFISPLTKKIFKLNGDGTLAFILSIFSGTPSNAYIIREMYEKKQINLETSNRLLTFTYFSNPFFLYNILSLSYNQEIVFKIILIHYFSNLIIALLFTRKNYDNEVKMTINNEKSFFIILQESIKKSINTLLIILGAITFFMIVSNVFIELTNFNQTFNVFLRGLFELTQGLECINQLNTSSMIKEIITIIIISFGGLSIHMQTFSIICDSDLSYYNFFKGRIYQVLISILITYLTYIF